MKAASRTLSNMKGILLEEEQGGAAGARCQLDDDWPTTLLARFGGTDDHDLFSPAASTLPMLCRVSTRQFLSRARTATSEFSEHGRGRPWYVIDPMRGYFSAHTILGCFFLAFDIMCIPWMLGWDVASEGVFFHIMWVTALYWSVDIGLSFITSYHHNGEEIIDLRAIGIRYLRSWFFADIIIVTCDWVSLFTLSSVRWRVLRFAKAGRLVRVVAMIRMVKVYRVATDLLEEKLTGYARLSFRFVKLFFITLSFAHMISCVWFWIGRAAPSNTGERWIRSSDAGDISEEDFLYQYITSFHWSIAQICLGAMEVNSFTTVERFYSLMCLILGLLFGSTLVSSLSAAMFQVQMDMRDNYLKMKLVHQFLREKEVGRTLAVQVGKQVSERLKQKVKVTEDKVKGLELLSASLRSKLRFDVVGRYLKQHSLFRLCINLDMALVDTLCRNCIRCKHLRRQDDVFHPGNEASCAYFFVSGALLYKQERESSPAAEHGTVEKYIKEHSWISEAALWSHWVHVGVAQASETTELAELRIAPFVEAMDQVSVGSELVRAYGVQFHRRLQAARPPTSDWPDDLQVPMTDWSDIVFSMSDWAQVVVGMDAVRTSSSRSWAPSHQQLRVRASALSALTVEIREGRSTVTLNASGEMERTVSLAALEIRSSRQQLLVELGKSDTGSMESSGKLPGGKQERGELVRETVDRLLDTKLAPIAPQLEVGHIERDIQWKPSQEYGIRTKYIRHVVSLSFNGELDEGDAVSVIRCDPTRRNSYCSVGSVGSCTAESPLPNTSPMTPTARARIGSDLARSLHQRDVFHIVGKKKAGFYAWLDKSEFEAISSPPGERFLTQWVSALCAAVGEVRAREPPKADGTGMGDAFEAAPSCPPSMSPNFSGPPLDAPQSL